MWGHLLHCLMWKKRKWKDLPERNEIIQCLLEQKGKSKDNFRSSPVPQACAWELGNQRFFLLLFLEKSLRDSPNQGVMANLVMPLGCAQKLPPTQNIYVCTWELQIFQGSTEMLGTRRKNICWLWTSNRYLQHY